MSGPNQPQGGASDPSMDDILASIRRILDEEGAKPDAGAPEHGGADHGAQGTGLPGQTHAAAAEPEAEDVLELQPSMILPEPDEAGAGPVPPPPAVLVEPVPVEEPAAAMPMPVPLPPPSMHGAGSGLVAPGAAAAAATSVGALLKTLASERTTAVHRGGPTIEDLVRDEIRPLLKDWLDQHLPPLVERLVRAEIERVVSRMG